MWRGFLAWWSQSLTGIRTHSHAYSTGGGQSDEEASQTLVGNLTHLHLDGTKLRVKISSYTRQVKSGWRSKTMASIVSTQGHPRGYVVDVLSAPPGAGLGAGEPGAFLQDAPR